MRDLITYNTSIDVLYSRSGIEGKTIGKTDNSISEQQMKLYFMNPCQRKTGAIRSNCPKKIGYGGMKYINNYSKCNYRTIQQGFADLKQSDLISNPEFGIQAEVEKVIETLPGINEIFLTVIEKSHSRFANG
jgi:hypothetical protein